MYKLQATLMLIAMIAVFSLVFRAYGHLRSASATRLPAQSASASVTSFAAQQRDDRETARFLAARVERDPQDMIADNMLAGLYLQKVRETGSLDYLVRAERLVHTSLASVPAVENLSGLALLTRTQFMAHQWTAARDNARRMTMLDAGKSEPYGMLGDAQMELGNYDKAEAAFQTMTSLGGGIGTETRLGGYALINGAPRTARKHYSHAVSYALDMPIPPRETIAWCQWRMGETEFLVGHYADAENDYRDALSSFPNYYLVLASLGRVRAARGDLSDAIRDYEQAVSIIPYPTFVGALGDLYQLTGRPQDAAAQYALVSQISRLSKLNGELYNRQYALFYADHDLKPQEAYAEASREYAVRRDIYGADAVAWTALKAGKLAVARVRIKEALRLGTQDAMLFYHAGMISRASGDTAGAKAFLARALALNPQFDPLQSRRARQALAGLSAKA